MDHHSAAPARSEGKPGGAAGASVPSPGGRAAYSYRLHWHVLLVHFPISAFLGSFAFMTLHVFTRTACFELAGFMALASGAVVMIPTTVTGWTTWKRRYRGVRGRLFMIKIRIAFAMIAISSILTVWRTMNPVHSLDVAHSIWHVMYFTGIVLLLLGAAAEGYYGGRLNHK